MSERLKDLQRQRALAQEQLAWLEREIARESGDQPPTAVSTPSAAARPLAAADRARAEADAEAVLAQYKNDPQTLQSSVKRGCYLYFLAALALFGLGIFALYFFTVRRH